MISAAVVCGSERLAAGSGPQILTRLACSDVASPGDGHDEMTLWWIEPNGNVDERERARGMPS